MGAAGLNISSFLKHSADGGGRGQWLREWRKNKVGEVTIWLHTKAPIAACWSHQFMLEDTYQDRETGKTMPTLRWPRFVSPDTEMVHKNQYFREEDGSMRVPPDQDPFLILREWLRTPAAEHIGLEDAVFKWEHPKERKVIIWERGPLSGLVKRGQGNFSSTLDTRLDYIYVVVDDDDVASGPVFMREGKLLSQKISDVVKQQQKQYGEEEGDPTQHPYAFLLMAQDAKSPLNAFSAIKAERAVFSDEVWEMISGDEYPDPIPLSKPGDGDLEKIRDAMEAAAQVDLPLDEIFHKDLDVRRALIRSGPKLHSMGGAPRQSKSAQARKEAPPAERPPVPSNTTKPAQTTAAAPASGRRRKVEPAAAPPPPPEPETIACDECKHPMLPTDSKCGNCGAEYEVDAALDAQAPAEPAPPPATSKPKPAPTSKAAEPAAQPASKPSTTGAKPRPRTKQQPAETQGNLPMGEATDDQSCWACGATVTEGDKGADGTVICPSCGIDVGDAIPF